MEELIKAGIVVWQQLLKIGKCPNTAFSIQPPHGLGLEYTAIQERWLSALGVPSKLRSASR